MKGAGRDIFCPPLSGLFYHQAKHPLTVSYTLANLNPCILYSVSLCSVSLYSVPLYSVSLYSMSLYSVYVYFVSLYSVSLYFCLYHCISAHCVLQTARCIFYMHADHKAKRPHFKMSLSLRSEQSQVKSAFVQHAASNCMHCLIGPH